MLAAVVLAAALLGAARAAPEADRIVSMPRYNGTVPFTQYSGYLNAGGQKRLHYWLTEASQGNPAELPLMLWLNGTERARKRERARREARGYRGREGGKEREKEEISVRSLWITAAGRANAVDCDCFGNPALLGLHPRPVLTHSPTHPARSPVLTHSTSRGTYRRRWSGLLVALRPAVRARPVQV